MKLTLKRSMCAKRATLGELLVNGRAECFILEDADRQLELDPTKKVYGETCIPRGTYKVIITYSNRFKRELPLLVDVPGYTGVRLHPGNRVEHSEGCLLPGTSFSTEGDTYVVNNSREAFRRLYEKLEAAIDAGEDVEIEIL